MNLPIPTPEAKAHSQRLLQHILDQIQKEGGSLSFATYMALALYAPSLGYYRGGLEKFGSTGDFITAPERSALFSQTLARQCQQILSSLPDSHILEIGAGSGRMAADILTALEKKASLPQHYFILELSAELKERQSQTLSQQCPHLLSRVIWLDTLPSTFKGVILANEVLDAMPVHLFQFTENAWHEIRIRAQEDTLYFHLSKTPTPDLGPEINRLSVPNAYTTEINFNIKPWMASLGDILEKGVILMLDYGFPEREYYHPDRMEGTLMCHYRHRAHPDPFWYPGLQDITAHVNFSAVADSAFEAGLAILGYCEQASFLLSAGLLEVLADNPAASELERIAQNQAIHCLTSAAEMGELFKVMAVGRNFDEPLIGFQLNDRRYAL